MNSLVLIWILSAIPPALIGDSGALCREADSLFTQAGQSLRQDPKQSRRLYAKAAASFSTAAVLDPANGKLLYNLANAHFLAGDLGRAILNYRRAEQFIPDDPNLRHNLAHARRQRLDAVGGPEAEQALRTLLFWHYDLPRATRTALFVTTYLLLWAFAIWRLYARRTEARWGLTICAAASLLLGGSLAVDLTRPRRAREGVVISASTTARQGDGPAYQPAFTAPLHAGAEFSQIESRNAWRHIELTDHRRCWVNAADVELVKPL
jgi:tetratricopeptide (TPR) repeat protein